MLLAAAVLCVVSGGTSNQCDVRFVLAAPHLCTLQTVQKQPPPAQPADIKVVKVQLAGRTLTPSAARRRTRGLST